MKHFLPVLLALCCIACAKPEYTITLSDPSSANLSLSYTAATVPVGFTSTQSWTASVVSQQPDGWLYISPSSGSAGTASLSLVATENTTFDEHTAVVRLTCGSTTQDIKVTQGVQNKMIVSVDKVSVAAEGGDFQIDVTTNIGVKMEIAADATWIHSNGTKAAESSSYSFTADANNLYGIREGVITFSSTDGAVTTAVTVSQASKNRSQQFDESSIIATFGVMSDTHLYDAVSAPATKLRNALQQVKAKAEATSGNLDGILIAGDFIDNGYSSRWDQLEAWKSIYESVLSPDKYPMVYCLGNHDVAGWMNNRGTMVSDAKNFRNTFGQAYYTTDKDPDAGTSMECRHCQIAGYNILAITPVSHTPVTYDTKAVSWLDSKLKELTTAEPDKYIIVLTHAMIEGTVYGSDLVSAGVMGDANTASYWYSTQLKPVLEKYPQVVTFSGHLHFPLNDPRSIWQGKFTAMGTASTRYMAFEGGTYYVNKSGTTTLSDKDEYSQGILLQFDVNGNMRATRMDFYHSGVIGDPWDVSFPDATGLSHLQKYSFATREAANTTPDMGSIEVEQKSSSSSSYVPCVLKFAAAKDDQFAHHYEINLTGTGYNTTAWLMSDYYLKPQPSDMKSTYTYSLGSLPAGTYDVTVVAVDPWNSRSQKATKTFTVGGGGGGSDTSTLPEPYVDLSMQSAGVIDAKGNVTVTSNGATVVSETYKHGSKSGKLNALSTSNGKFVTCTFREMTTASDMKAFAAGGFSVETFFMDPSGGSATQAIVCGTEQGGWGLAELESGVPYFIVGEDKYNNYVRVDANASVSRSELTHLVAVYDATAKSMRIYINGKLSQSGSCSGVFYPGNGSACNQFCLGSDICVSGNIEYPSVNMRIVTAKVYSSPLSDKQVDLAYQAAQKIF